MLGSMHSESWDMDPKHLGFVLARYKFVSKMLVGKKRVLEIGCGDTTGSRIVKSTVGHLEGIDIDAERLASSPSKGTQWEIPTRVWNILDGPLPHFFDAVYALDVMEHISPEHEDTFLKNIGRMMHDQSVLIIGMPSFESQMYASKGSRDHHVNCVLPGAIVEGNIVAALKSLYAGPAVEVITKRGKRLSLTIKHPVLTAQGWVAAGSLRQGMKLFANKTNVSRIVNGNERPPAIEDVFATFKRFGSCRSAATVDDLHGDARFVKGDVDIVSPNLGLLRNLQAKQAEFVGNGKLIMPRIKKALIAGLGSCEQGWQGIALSAPSNIGVSGLLFSLASRHAVELDTSRFGASADWHTVPLQESGNGISIDAKSLSELVHRSSGEIEIDEVIGLRRFEYVGHVYDLQSVAGYHTANGLYISNCKTELGLRYVLEQYFENVFIFGMSDEVIHTGFGGMCHYRLAIATGLD